jgi:hypothetical protein
MAIRGGGERLASTIPRPTWRALEDILIATIRLSVPPRKNAQDRLREGCPATAQRVEHQRAVRKGVACNQRSRHAGSVATQPLAAQARVLCECDPTTSTTIDDARYARSDPLAPPRRLVP